MSIPVSAVAAASGDVAALPSRTAKIARLAELLRAAAPREAGILVSWLIGVLPQGRIGVGPAAVRAAAATPAATSPSLTVSVVDGVFSDLAGVSGRGASVMRAELLAAVFERATAPEQEFLARLLHGELRQGALEGVMADAIASAANVAVTAVRSAAQLAGGLPPVAVAVLAGGAAGLDSFAMQVFTAVQPMLAQPAASIEEALDRLGPAAVDWKLDGARVQVHRRGGEVRVYTRRLNEVTASVPELVATVLELPVTEIVLDGEAIALRQDGRPLPFQVTMSRFSSRTDVAARARDVPLTTLFFDCLYLDGVPLLDRSAAERFATMSRLLPPGLIVNRTITADLADARRALESAWQHGHEGVVVKAMDAPYEAGRRGGAWLKVKQADTLDLVVLAAEWGSGRRRGWLSNLHLGARDPAAGFIMLGKTFKGLTDATLEWQTRELLAREVRRDGHVVHVRPELVVEVAFEGVQASPRYPAGLALRFARVKGYRPDRNADDADTIERVREIHARHTGGTGTGIGR
jgi:DNA ligase 1